MYIKGFNKDLKCRGYQFEVGQEYKIETEEELQLCSDTVFHFCDSLEKAHLFYGVSIETNRFCEVEVLGGLVEDLEKCGSNHIKIKREIVGEELESLKGLKNGNTGLFNSGDWNSGDWNSGYRNSGNRNSGYRNSGDWNSGDWNSGNWNSGNRNSGNRNSGNRNSGDWNSGNRNSGYRNSGDWNSGNRNSGYFNSCDFSAGFFCTEEPKAIVFNIETNMTVTEFRDSEYYQALLSSPFMLTEWVEYSEEERRADKEKELTGGYSVSKTFHEACTVWWEAMSDENKAITMDIPNFDAKIFKEITGIEVEE